MRTFGVIGLGRFGVSVTMQLFKMGYEVLAIDKNIDRVNAMADYATTALCGDAKDENVLKNIGIRNCDCVIVAIGNDLTDSILTTLLLKEFDIKQIVCRARDNQHKKVLKKIGADNVVIPEQETGIKTAVNLVSGRLIDMIDLSDEFGIADIIVPSVWVGKSINALSIRKRYGINIVAIKSQTDKHEVNISPSPEYIFKDKDIVVLVGRSDIINELTAQ